MSTATSTRTILRAEGFACPSCVTKIEKAVKKQPGVESVKVHFASSRIEIQHDPQAVSVDQLVQTVADAGYDAKPSAF